MLTPRPFLLRPGGGDTYTGLKWDQLEDLVGGVGGRVWDVEHGLGVGSDTSVLVTFRRKTILTFMTDSEDGPQWSGGR